VNNFGMIVYFADNTNCCIKSKDLSNELAIELEDVERLTQVRGLCEPIFRPSNLNALMYLWLLIKIPDALLMELVCCLLRSVEKVLQILDIERKIWRSEKLSTN